MLKLQVNTFRHDVAYFNGHLPLIFELMFV